MYSIATFTTFLRWSSEKNDMQSPLERDGNAKPTFSRLKNTKNVPGPSPTHVSGLIDYPFLI
jgi:hypothetical protein